MSTAINPNTPATSQKPHRFNFTPLMQKTGLELYGARVSHNPVKEDPITHIKNIRALNVREDDVFILAYSKCGTHWMCEIAHMLLTHAIKYEIRTKEHMMIEFNVMSTLDREKSPRLMNSHLRMCHLPTQIVDKKAKIIHMVRNPKDTMVSLYHHLKQMQQDDLTLGILLDAFIDNDQLSMEHQFDYLRQISEFEKAHPDHPILHVHYENLKKDPVKVIEMVAEFLQVPACESFYEEVAAACAFDKMKEMDKGRKFPKHFSESLLEMGVPELSFYRKGVIGDWKTSLTEAQNKVFDAFIEEEMAKGCDFQFIYE